MYTNTNTLNNSNSDYYINSNSTTGCQKGIKRMIQMQGYQSQTPTNFEHIASNGYQGPGVNIISDD